MRAKDGLIQAPSLRASRQGLVRFADAALLRTRLWAQDAANKPHKPHHVGHGFRNCQNSLLISRFINANPRWTILCHLPTFILMCLLRLPMHTLTTEMLSFIMEGLSMNFPNSCKSIIALTIMA